MANRPYNSGSSQNGPIREAGGKGGKPSRQGIPIQIDPDWVVSFNDFLTTNDYIATDWTITTTEDGTGSATESITAGNANGELVILNDDADNDVDSLQNKIEAWKLEANKKLFMEMRVKVSDADAVDMMVGLSITDTTPRDSSDRINFAIDDGDATIRCQNAKNSSETETVSSVDAVDDTYVKLGFLVDGTSNIKFYINGNLEAQHSTNLPDDENLAVTLNIQNGAAAAKSLTVDYILVCIER